jgi:hypothetical protein
MATTTNFGWSTPDDTSLVKDGAAAIRTLGQSIDTSMMDLEGGTTGQVLSKASNTDMDFTWTSNGATGPTFRAFQSSNQSVSSETWTKLTLQSETFDTANNFDSTTNYRWTPTTAGYYSISASVNIARTNTNGFGYCRIYKNGANTGANNFAAMGAESQTIVSLSDVVYMNGSSDYLEVYVWISGSGATTYSGTSSTYFTGIWIRS